MTGPSLPASDAGRILFGAAYYHEYRPVARLEEDLDLMAAAGFSVIRVGESVWSTWEPSDGRFDLDWIQPVLDGAHARGIRVILGTPTYAVPLWLARRHPEINAEPSTGRPMGWGRRQEIDYTDPTFRWHAERVIRAIMARHLGHPAVVGVQVDNEPGVALLHNRPVFQRFVDHLHERYRTVERLTEEWGLTYWSHRLSDWADLWLPDGNAQPQYDLAWRRFQAELLDEFIAWQVGIVREYARPEQLVTTCYSYFARPALDDESCARSLDILSGNSYLRMQDALAAPSSPVVGGSPMARTDGAWRVALSGDRMYAGKQAPFLVTETTASSIGPQWLTEPPWDGQWRQVAWLLVARGAQMIEYWHWHSLPFGAETYWGGVLPHDDVPGRVYTRIAELGAEIATLGDRVVGLRPRSDMAMLASNESRWAGEFSPFLATGRGAGDPESFLTMFSTVYRTAFEAGLEMAIVHAAQALERSPEELVREHPVLLVFGVIVAGDALLDRLAAYAAAGGHLVIGPRTGYEDLEARARGERHPARLAEAAGVSSAEFATTAVPVPVEPVPPLDTGGTAHGLGWIDYLEPAGARVLARYAHDGFAPYAAVTTHEHGRGRVTVVGTLPDDALAAAVLDWVVPVVEGTWRAAARQIPSVSVASAETPRGTVLRFVHHWGWGEGEITVPEPAVDLCSGRTFDRGEALVLGPWDVRILEVADGPADAWPAAPEAE